MADKKIKLRGRPQDWAGGPPEPEPPEDLLVARGDSQEGPRTPLPNAPPTKGYKLFVSLWEQQFEAVDKEGKPTGRQFKRLEIRVKSHQCTAGALLWWDAETGAEQGVPWWRVASFEAEAVAWKVGPPKPWPEVPPVVPLPDFDAIECEGRECAYCEGTGRQFE